MRTLLSPEELLERLHQLEQEANRERIIHWGPRTLDLDILFYDQEIIDTADLHIPHPDMQNRDFVLAPMNQIAPLPQASCTKSDNFTAFKYSSLPLNEHVAYRRHHI